MTQRVQEAEDDLEIALRDLHVTKGELAKAQQVERERERERGEVPYHIRHVCVCGGGDY